MQAERGRETDYVYSLKKNIMEMKINCVSQCISARQLISMYSYAYMHTCMYVLALADCNKNIK